MRDCLAIQELFMKLPGSYLYKGTPLPATYPYYVFAYVKLLNNKPVEVTAAWSVASVISEPAG